MNRKELHRVVFLLLFLLLPGAYGDSGAKEEKARSGRPAVAVEASKVTLTDLKARCSRLRDFFPSLRGALSTG
jgi:hypothetical protein